METPNKYPAETGLCLRFFLTKKCCWAPFTRGARMQRQTGTADSGDNICAISDAAAGDLPSLVSCNYCLWLLPKKRCQPRDGRATRKSGQTSADGESCLRPDQRRRQPRAWSCSRSPLSGPKCLSSPPHGLHFGSLVCFTRYMGVPVTLW